MVECVQFMITALSTEHNIKILKGKTLSKTYNSHVGMDVGAGCDGTW